MGNRVRDRIGSERAIVAIVVAGGDCKYPSKANHSFLEIFRHNTE